MQKMIFNKAAVVLSICFFALFFSNCRKNVPTVAEQPIAEVLTPEQHGLCEISMQFNDGFDCSNLNDTVWNIVKPYWADDAKPPREVQLPAIFDLFKKENVLVYIEMDGEIDTFFADYYWYLPSQGIIYYYVDEYLTFNLRYTSATQPTYAEIKEKLTQTDGNTTAAMNCEVRNDKVYSIEGIIRY